MKDTPYIAHRAEDGRIQTVREHLIGTSKLAGDFAAAFGYKEWGELCGLLHDVGKYSKAFQARIRGSGKKVDHSTAGAVETMKMGAVPASFCVAGHHGGLPDGGNHKTDTGEEGTLFGRIRKTIPDYSAWKEDVDLPPLPSMGAQKGFVEQAFLTRMLYSSLVDADYLDTEKFMRPHDVQRGGGENMEQLLEKLMDYITRKKFLSPLKSEGTTDKESLNQYRADTLSSCIRGAKQSPGLFSLTVPTGGGKTIASLAFALHHAVQHGLDRIIYVIPYCSIIDQTAEVFRNILGSENVLEHHSGVVYDMDEDGCVDQGKAKMALAAENWDAPVVVTTSVQFFESLYASKPSRCRKLHNIASSVIILDEAQMMPFACLMPCVSALGQLALHYRASVVLCTATQPSLDGLFARLAPQLTRRELYPRTTELYQKLRRVTYVHAGKMTNVQLAEELQAHKCVLCIVNRRSQAKELYDRLSGEGNVHLSTLMYPEHRSRVIREVRDRLAQGLPCRVISTSLIEAGVDLDFPVVYRAEAGLDSIIQAGGRCNREGKQNAQDSRVIVFQSEDAAPKMLAANVGAMQETVTRHTDLGSPEAIQAYFRSLMSLKGEQAMDQHKVLKAFEEGDEGKIFPFREVAKRFALIDTKTKTVYIPKEEGAQLVQELQNGEASKQLFQRLGRYSVAVYAQDFEALERVGDIAMVGEEAAVLSNLTLYDENTGLSLNAQEGKHYFIE